MSQKAQGGSLNAWRAKGIAEELVPGDVELSRFSAK
jgi:hypothetical protein